MDLPFENITAAILNGGRGTRLGGVDKMLIEVDGETILSRTLQVLKPLFKTIIIAGNSHFKTTDSYIKVVSDRYHGAGPIAGIEAALFESETPFVFVFAGDMPWLSADLIKREVNFMYDNPCDIVVPRFGGYIEPLHSLFSKKVLPALKQYLEQNPDHAVRSFYSLADVRYFDIDPSDYGKGAFTNINTPDDLNRTGK